MGYHGESEIPMIFMIHGYSCSGLGITKGTQISLLGLILIKKPLGNPCCGWFYFHQKHGEPKVTLMNQGVTRGVATAETAQVANFQSLGDAETALRWLSCVLNLPGVVLCGPYVTCWLATLGFGFLNCICFNHTILGCLRVDHFLWQRGPPETASRSVWLWWTSARHVGKGNFNMGLMMFTDVFCVYLKGISSRTVHHGLLLDTMKNRFQEAEPNGHTVPLLIRIRNTHWKASCGLSLARRVRVTWDSDFEVVDHLPTSARYAHNAVAIVGN